MEGCQKLGLPYLDQDDDDAWLEDVRQSSAAATDDQTWLCSVAASLRSPRSPSGRNSSFIPDTPPTWWMQGCGEVQVDDPETTLAEPEDCGDVQAHDPGTTWAEPEERSSPRQRLRFETESGRRRGEMLWGRAGSLGGAFSAAESVISAALAGIPNAAAVQASLRSTQRAKVEEVVRDLLERLDQQISERREKELSALARLLKVRADRVSRRNILLLWRSAVTTRRNQAMLDCMEQENVKLKLKVKKFVSFLARETQM